MQERMSLYMHVIDRTDIMVRVDIICTLVRYMKLFLLLSQVGDVFLAQTNLKTLHEHNQVVGRRLVRLTRSVGKHEKGRTRSIRKDPR